MKDEYLSQINIMNHQLISVLKDYGFSEKEAKIYLTTLELGSAPASTIGRRADIKRVTTYTILRDLQRRQIASLIEKDGVTHFQVIDPTKLLENLEKKTRHFRDAVPQLLAMTDVYGNKPKIEYFEWINGIKTMYEDMLQSKTDIHAFLSVDAIQPELRDILFKEHVTQRVKKKIFAKVIANFSEVNESYKEADKQQYRETLIVKDKITEFASEIDMYGPNKVMISMYSGDELFGMIIHSQKLYNTLLGIFNLVRQAYKK